jgi:peptidoglycan hydrolase FlgJ
MEIQSFSAPPYDAMTRVQPVAAKMAHPRPAGDQELRDAFQDFVGQTFYSQMLSSLRQTVGKPAYMHGGRAEEVFQTQLDQVLAEKLSDATADTFTEPMYQLFTLPRP